MRSDAIIGAVQGVTKKWAKQRKKEEREASARQNRQYAMTTRRQHTSIVDAAWQVMEEAYLKVSANGKLPAHARQIMYAARPKIERLADPLLGSNFDKYFTKQLLPNYIREQGVSWNVVFDARGNFHEPHTGMRVPMGTLEVRKYLSQVSGYRPAEPNIGIRERRFPTLGPNNRYGAILFVEKEGFMPLFKAVKLAERYDIAIMSTKGMSVTASRELVDKLCADHDIPLLVAHDFDKAGFSIVGTLMRDTERYSFENKINVIDIGLRLEDIDGLETETVYTKSKLKARWNLRDNGATEEEIEFLLNQRVELNMFTSDKLISWIESKFEEHGVSKVIPDDDRLTYAYSRARKQVRIQQRIDEMIKNMKEDKLDRDAAPKGLRSDVEQLLRDDPATSWDVVVRELAEDAADDAEEDE